MSATELYKPPRRGAALDESHIGDIRDALGTIRHCDIAPRNGGSARLRTLLAILGPGLIVMVGDNAAGAFGTYTQAGQLAVLRGYLVVAGGLVLWRIVELALAAG